VVTIERKGSDNLAKSGATAVDQSNLGQAPIAGIHEAWYGLKGNHVALSKTGNSLPTSFGLVYHSQYGFIENL